MADRAPAIEIKGLRKVFNARRADEVVALDGIDLVVERGEIFGFLGRNGAGKTTTVKILMNMISAYDGDCAIHGVSTRDARSRKRIGFLPEGTDFQGWLTAEEIVRFHAELQGWRGSLGDHAAELLERVGLEEQVWKRKVAGFSKGMLQRLGIAVSMAGDPDVIFLDEPIANLDPIGQRDVKALLLDLERQGRTVFLNSHLLSDVELTCHRVAILERGRVIKTGDVLDLTQMQPYAHIRATETPEALLADLREHSSDVALLDGTIVMRIRTEDDLDPVPGLVEKHGAKLRRLVVAHESLEEVFLRAVASEPAAGAEQGGGGA